MRDRVGIAQINSSFTVSTLSLFSTTVVLVFVLSELDYCTHCVMELTVKLCARLQFAQNFTATLIYNKTKYEPITQYFMNLHWLLTMYQILCKIFILALKFRNYFYYTCSDKVCS